MRGLDDGGGGQAGPGKHDSGQPVLLGHCTLRCLGLTAKHSAFPQCRPPTAVVGIMVKSLGLGGPATVPTPWGSIN